MYNPCSKKLYAATENIDVPTDYSIDCAGGDLIYLIIEFPIYIILVALIEGDAFSRFNGCCEPKKNEDNKHKVVKDQLVLDDEARCDRYDMQHDPPAILAQHVRKLYRTSASESTIAVDDVSLSVRKGECFALLGTSGSGKTTTFKMITNDILPSGGKVYINGMELSKNFPAIRKLIGYGPQYESSNMAMTVRENLEFYAKLKGIPADLQPRLISKIIDEMTLGEYENILAEQLSGGNKRKLTVAIALLGNPPIVLLDEPSTGVDPESKRFMWHIIQRVSTQNKNTAIILTTHAMDEAEYLCSKMAIMVNGDFCCIGTPQELKTLYGKGYEIQVSIPPPSEKDESEFLSAFNIAPESEMTREKIVSLFSVAQRPELADQLSPQGNAAHMDSQLKTGHNIKAAVVASYILIEQAALALGQELANEYGEVKVPEHIGGFYKFRVDKTKPTHTIGHLFGLMQDLVGKYRVTQYSASQTSLSQIFQTFAKQAEYGLAVGKDAMVIKAVPQGQPIAEPAPALPKGNGTEVVIHIGENGSSKSHSAADT